MVVCLFVRLFLAVRCVTGYVPYPRTRGYIFRQDVLYYVGVGLSIAGCHVVRASQKSEVKKESQSCRMKGIKKRFHGGETHYGLYYIVSREPRRPRAARQADAIALRGVPTGGGWSKGAWETL